VPPPWEEAVPPPWEEAVPPPWEEAVPPPWEEAVPPPWGAVPGPSREGEAPPPWGAGQALPSEEAPPPWGAGRVRHLRRGRRGSFHQLPTSRNESAPDCPPGSNYIDCCTHANTQRSQADTRFDLESHDGRCIRSSRASFKPPWHGRQRSYFTIRIMRHKSTRHSMLLLYPLPLHETKSTIRHETQDSHKPGPTSQTLHTQTCACVYVCAYVRCASCTC